MTGMFAFILSVIESFFTRASATQSLPLGTQSSSSLDLYPTAPNNTLELECDDDVRDKSEWDMMSVALATYKLYWFESQQREADSSSSSKRRRTEKVMPPLHRENTIAQIANAAGGLGSAMWNFVALIITLLPNLGARVVNIIAMVALVIIALYLFVIRGFGDVLVRKTQSVMIGFLFPNASAVVKEF